MATKATIQLAPRGSGLLAHLIARLLTRAALIAPEAIGRMHDRRIRLRTDTQAVVLVGNDQGLTVTPDDAAPVDAEIIGDLASLLAAARGRMWGEVLSRRLRVRGRFWRCGPLLTLFTRLRSTRGTPVVTGGP